ncbi:MAG: hypothetical protein QM757_21710 [Paludibaculum sp.]
MWLASPVWGRASGTSLTGYSGAPNESTCTRCHSGTANSGSGKLTITPDSTTFTAGQQIHLKVTMADSTGRRWGYELSPRQTSATSSALGDADDGRQSFAGHDGERAAIRHANLGGYFERDYHLSELGPGVDSAGRRKRRRRDLLCGGAGVQTTATRTRAI